MPASAQDGPIAPLSWSEQDRRCLSLAIAYEAAREPVAGQQAVAEVVLNRLAHPSFPKSVCGVVFQGWRRSTGCQFTFTCDGSLRRRLSIATMAEARTVADAVLDGAAPRRVPGALNYHADYVRPVWAASLLRVNKLGAHIFYRPLPGGVAEGARQVERDWTAEEPDGAVIDRAYASGGALPAAMPAVHSAAVSSTTRSDGPFAPWGLPLTR
ncbi:cell wall hydrolase [Novosphingobium cyanobacteriorum]|uniref:Cell wall hydrolase n=1 Tax=Novosphingobium cyanobacteriorum TaxID=3024215 RepID=A0ABT6CKA6_9SPHN|nr:cell wall hydrolase [Novosphingobium cyanobacteriorum]MDF8334364.1 cell wall hydrolase [Novosphingobium cyanobacteriorum]